MGEFLRKYVVRRPLALSKGEIVTAAIRQLGVGSQGGAEALAIFHQLFYDEWAASSVNEPLARIKVDEKNGFGMMEWYAVREAESRFLPKHTAAATWKHRDLSHVEQEGLPPMPKDRGAEQGDVDGLLECSVALGMVAAEARGRVLSRRQAAFRGVVTPQVPSACNQNTQSDCRKLPTSSWVAQEKLTGANDPRHVLQKNGRLACGTWMMVTLCVTQS